eukprot:4306652-Pleurochrysis_carterae.AAC.4
MEPSVLEVKMPTREPPGACARNVLVLISCTAKVAELGDLCTLTIPCLGETSLHGHMTWAIAVLRSKRIHDSTEHLMAWRKYFGHCVPFFE